MILGIESSCDESALALLDPERGLIGEWISSQVSLHAEYGGVVPDLASREHLNNFGPLLTEMRTCFDLEQITEIVVTGGPGLAGCLAMGVSVANSLSIALDTPLYAANHLQAHAQSVFIPEFEAEPVSFDERLRDLLPHLSLIVSGGNTLLTCIHEDRSFEALGQTIDDAAGEALDKGAKLLGLGYPGGPKLESMAKGGRMDAFDFPRALIQKPNLDFSFSGLKTSLRYLLEGYDESSFEAIKSDVCASYQEAVVDALIRKSSRCLKNRTFRSIGLSGGVSNNQSLRERFLNLGRENGIPALLAEPRHTGDNAGMIAFSHLFCDKSRRSGPVNIVPSATLERML